MTSEHPARAPEKKIWTGGRVASAALVFSLLAVALSSSCNPTDSTRDGSKAIPSPTPAAASGAPPRQADQSAPPAQMTPTPLPDELLNSALTTLDGQTLKLSDLKGKVVVLNLWATWCGPCRREIPDFIKIQEDYAGRGVEVLGITSEDERNTAASVKEFVTEFKINYKVVWVDAKGWEAFLAPRYSIPQTYVLGTDGNLIRKFVGYSPQVATMVRQIADQSLGNAAAAGGR
ncbi:MAG TPA: TlpA disulfide reductase family protein [Pyrinomonadaceae bacterium]|jgi:cytochrome c biogenesis protein CcmG/thiol:disulfide interchange protein DsbE